MLSRQQLVEKWKKVLDHENAAPIKDTYRREVTAVLLENQEQQLIKESGVINEVAPNNSGGAAPGLNAISGAGSFGASGAVTGYDPVLISLVRRSAPLMMAYDVCGVQPLTQPTGLIFAMKSRYQTQGGAEALFNKPNVNHASSLDGGTTPGATTSIATADAEGGIPAQMAFSIEKTSVVARSKMLKAEYSLELAQDLQAVHGLSAETELSNILSAEILSEINREIIDVINTSAYAGCAVGTTTAGTFDLDTDSNGRWSVEKFKGLMFQIEREANIIAQMTRRGRGNFIICSSDVASALAMAGVLDYTPAIAANANLKIDDSTTTFAGILNGKYKVYIDPYAGGASNLSVDGSVQYVTVGYKGASAFDAGIFYCPYTSLQKVNAVDPDTLQPKFGFKTRYGIVANPFATDAVTDGGGLTANSNVYYRKFTVANLM